MTVTRRSPLSEKRRPCVEHSGRSFLFGFFFPKMNSGIAVARIGIVAEDKIRLRTVFLVCSRMCLNGPHSSMDYSRLVLLAPLQTTAPDAREHAQKHQTPNGNTGEHRES